MSADDSDVTQVNDQLAEVPSEEKPEQLLEFLESWPWVNSQFYGNAILSWALALIVALVAVAALRIIISLVRRRAKKFAEKTTNKWDDGAIQALEVTKTWFLLVLALYFGSLVLTLPENTRDIVESIAIIALLVQSAYWGVVLLEFALRRYTEDRLQEDPAAATTLSALSFLGKLAIWSIVLLLSLDNLGVDVTAMVAGLGVGGIAVALAAQNILGDLFASMSIVLDKPFVLGDFIIVGDQTGTVEKIGMKTTRLRALSGEQLIFSNTDLLDSRIRNFKRMYERRIVFPFGVTYEISLEKLEKIPDMVREIVESHDDVRFDRSHFKSYGDFSLDFETVYIVLVPDYARYMDIQQSINLKLFKQFAEQGIEFAYPTQRLLVERSDEPAE